MAESPRLQRSLAALLGSRAQWAHQAGGGRRCWKLQCPIVRTDVARNGWASTWWLNLPLKSISTGLSPGERPHPLHSYPPPLYNSSLCACPHTGGAPADRHGRHRSTMNRQPENQKSKSGVTEDALSLKWHRSTRGDALWSWHACMPSTAEQDLRAKSMR